MRRAVILGLLLLGMQWVLPLGVAGHHSQSLLTFGFLILAAYTVGEIAVALGQPRIVGYLFAGLVFGPSVLGVVTRDAVTMLVPVNTLAIALIAYLAGAELRWEEVKPHAGAIGKILISEIPLTFLLLALLLLALRPFIPFLAEVPPGEAVALSFLFASMGVVHSPAVTMGVLSETGARGPLARTVLGVVLVSDLVVILLFSATLTVAQGLAPPSEAPGEIRSVGWLAWELGGSFVVGAAIGGAVSVYIRFVKRELFLFAIMVAFFGAEVARITHVDTLLTLIVAGVVSENLSPRDAALALRGAMERSAAPLFVVFFALAGASLDLRAIASVWPLVIPIVLLRAFGMWFGTRFGARWAGASPEITRYAWTGFVSQAGVAIGLVTIVAQIYPERGAQMMTLFMSTLAVNTFLGPILFKRALVQAGEVVAPTSAPATSRETPTAAHAPPA